MNHIRKRNLIAVLLSFIFVFSAMSLSISKANNVDSEKKIVILGDSIATGYGLADYNSSGNPKSTISWATLLSGRYEATQYNYAVDGDTTADLLSVATTKQDTIATADVICVSIGGNNFLQLLATYADNWTGIFNVNEDAEEMLTQAAIDLDSIFTKLRETNPKALIMVQTLYNPYYYSTAKLTLIGINATVGEWMGGYIDDYNDILKQKIKNHGFVCVDVAKKFKEEGKESWLNTKSYSSFITMLSEISSMDPHPSAEGHNAIYQTYVETADVQIQDALNNYLDVSKYRSGTTYKAPTESGKVFAGWYTDTKFTTPLGKDVTTGKAYAKFVPANVLGVKAQISTETTKDSPSTDLRFLTSVNDLNYAKIGFKIHANGKTVVVGNNTVYKTLTVRLGEGVLYKKTPPQVFDSTSTYFKAYVLGNVPNNMFDTEIEVTPYWITLDGTTVYGETAIKRVRDGIPTPGLHDWGDGDDMGDYGQMFP